MHRIVAILLVLGCGSDPRPMTTDGAQPPDAPPDIVPPDAAPSIDAPPPSPAPAAGREIGVANGRLTGGGWSVEVHVGSTASQTPTSSGTWTGRGGSPIHP